MKKINKAKLIKLLKLHYQQVLIVFIAFFTMGLVSSLYVSNIVRKQAYDISSQTISTIKISVNDKLESARLLFSDIVRVTEKMTHEDANNDEILEYLCDVQKYYNINNNPNTSLPEYMKIYGYINNEFLDGSLWIPFEGYDATERPWYIGALNANDLMFFSEPYQDADTGNTCISFSQVVYRHSSRVDVLSIDLDLSRITNEIKNQRISNDGYGMLISDNYTLATHQNSDLVGTNIADIGGGYTKIYEMLKNDQQISAFRFIDYDGTDSIVFCESLFNDWHIGIVTSKSSYTSLVKELIIVIVLLGFTMACILSFILVRTRIQKIRSEEESMSKNTFLTHMSHEMRTPMNAIIGMAEIASSTTDQQKISACIDKISGASKHLLGVINDVLDMSKIGAGKLELSISDFVFLEMIENIISVMNFKISEKKQNFIMKIDNNVPVSIISDRQRLAQVITNLLSNANKFTPENGDISLFVHCLENNQKQCTIKIEIIDTGIGISKEQQTKLFNSFVQADSSISRRYGGTGLGLAISKKIVELMNGTVEVISDLGKGANFNFTFKAEVGKLKSEDHQISDKMDYCNIFADKYLLLAEDVEINREVIVTLLEETGVKIDCVENGQEAYMKFAENPDQYDLIFMDIQMPEVDGLEATKIIRNMDHIWAKNIPIVAMTANVFKEDVDRCMAAGMNDHIGKPIEIDEVIKKIAYYTKTITH